MENNFVFSLQKKPEENRKFKLLEQINKLENEIPINQEEVDNKGKKLYDIRQKKMKGAKIRS